MVGGMVVIMIPVPQVKPGENKLINTDSELPCCTGSDSDIFEDWIAHCVRKHVKGNVEPKMTQDQCVAAAYQKLRKGELRKRGDARAETTRGGYKHGDIVRGYRIVIPTNAERLKTVKFVINDVLDQRKSFINRFEEDLLSESQFRGLVNQIARSKGIKLQLGRSQGISIPIVYV